jgi:hypothetical protein
MKEHIDCKQIRRAFKMTQVMAWAVPLIQFGVLFVSIFVALRVHGDGPVLVGFVIVAFNCVAGYFIGRHFCCCPKCGQYWRAPGPGLFSLMRNAETGAAETESFKCSGCGLEIGPYLKKSNRLQRD